MARKSNPEKDVTISSASAAAARPRRTTTAARAKRTVTAAAETSPAPVRAPETIDVPTVYVAERQLSHEEIARVAYSLWEARGCQGGNPEEDWTRAEQQLRLRAVVAPS
jgi:hypothetical protein